MKLNTLLFFALLCIISHVSAQKLDLSTLGNLNIRNVGPANMSGRITAIDAVDSNPKIIYVGAASGGVWKSENGGTAWKPVFDEQPTQNIGAIAIQQNNPDVVWVGTGEGNPRNSMNLGMGIFKSLDGGRTWQHLGLEQTRTIHRILIHPDNPDVVYVGALGDPWTPNEHRGLYMTRDGGKSWSKILYTNDQSGVADLVMDPKNPNKLMVALYEHRRTPYYFTSGGPGSGLFLTYDGGETWKKPGPEEGLPSGELGRIGIAIAPSDPSRVYAKIEAATNALYRSDDGGVTWEMINDDPKFTNNRPFYFQDLAVDSKDPNRLYNIYQPLSVSYDGGKTFDPTPMIPADETKGIHADFHAFWMNKTDPENFIIGGDGGIGITHDHGESWYFPESIPVAQFYQINVDHDRPYRVYGGMQDNGNWSGPGYTWKRGGIRTLYWQYLVGGDGFYISPDSADSRFGYGTSQNGNLYRYDRLTGYYVSIQPPPPVNGPVLRFNWNAGFARDPFDQNRAYHGSQFVHVTPNKGDSWEIISPDLTTNNPEHQKGDYGGLTLDISGAEMYNSILTIAPSPLKKEVIWVGTDDGQVQLTKDGGKTWTNLTKNLKDLPRESWVARIHASSHDPGSAWVVVNNYRKGDYNPYLFRTSDYGRTWQSLVDENEVRGYTLAVVQDPVEENLVFLGTEHGLWISIDQGENWVQFRNGYPSVSTMDLTIQKPESALIVGTFGRAIWVMDDLLSLREIAANRLKPSITALPMNDAVQVKGLFIAPPGNIWTGFNTTWEGENRVFQKTEIPFYLAHEITEGDQVRVAVYDAQNQQINEAVYTDLVRGLNYVTWKLDEKSHNLPGAWIHEESRGIPVLPGTYTIVLTHGEYADTTSVEVIPDPRFDLDPNIDQELYEFRKQVDLQVKRLSDMLHEIDSKSQKLTELAEQVKQLKIDSAAEILTRIEATQLNLKELRMEAQIPRPDRQVGAWRSFESSPYTSVNDLIRVSRARHSAISDQHLQRLDETINLLDEFQESFEMYMNEDWKTFEAFLTRRKINW